MFQKKISFSKKVAVFFVLVFVLGVGIYFSASKAKAASPGDVIINEVMWLGTSSSTEDEWIELRNTSGTAIDIANWTLENIAPGVNLTVTTTAGLCSTTTIPANGYFLISNFSSSSSAINVSAQCVTTTIDLNDDYSANGPLILKDNSGAIIDQTPSTTTCPNWPGGATGTQVVATSSMARNWNYGSGTSTASWHTSIIATGWDTGIQDKGTPGTYNGYPVSGQISQLNATTSGTIYIQARDHNDGTTTYAVFQTTTTGLYQIHLLESTTTAPSHFYDFFAFRDLDGNQQYDQGEPFRNLNNSGNGYSLTSSGLTNVNPAIGIAPTISAVSPSILHSNATATITGVHFGQDEITAQGEVLLNNSPVQVSSWSSTGIEIIVPQNAASGYLKVWLDHYESFSATTSVTVKPTITSAVATDKSVKVNFDNFMDGATAADLSNYTLESPIGTAKSLTDAWAEFRGNELLIKGIELSVGQTFKITASSNVKSGTGDTIDTTGNYNLATGTVVAAPSISYIHKKGEATTTNSGNVGDTVVIVGANFGSATGTVYFSPGPPTSGQPQEPLSSTPTSWTATSIEVPVPSGAKTGPVFIVTAQGVESEFSHSAFFNVLTNLNYRILDPNGNSVSTTTARIVICSLGGPVLHYVGDGNTNSSTTYNSATGVYTVHNIPSEGFNWVFDSSGTYVVAKGQPINSDATTTFTLATSTTKISGNITNARANSTIVVWADPVEGTGENMEWREPVFVKTDASGAGSYNIGLSATGTYNVGVEDPGFSGGSSSSQKISPANQEVSATTTSGVSNVNFAFITATRRIRGKISKAAGQGFDIGPGVEAFHVYAYQPKENGLHASAMPDSSGYFDLYVIPGVYIVGVGGPDLPSAVEKKVEVLSSDSDFATSDSAVDITLVIEAPDEYIEGQVTDSSGNGISGASIFAWSSSGPGGGQAFTNSAGYYKLYLSPGTYTLDGFAPNFGKLSQRTGISVPDGCADNGTCPRVDFGVSSELATISGYVKKNNASSSDMEVWVTYGQSGYGINRTKTDSNGNYTLKVPYGSNYYLHVAQPGAGEVYSTGTLAFSSTATSTTINVSINTATIYVQISPKSAFSKAFVEVYGPGGKGFSDKDISSDSDNYRKYAIEVPKPTSGTYTYNVRGGVLGYGLLTATTTSVTSGTVSKTISYDITSNVGTIAGTVTLSGTGTTTDAYVWAANTSGHSGTQVDSSGHFSFNLKAGTYDVGIDKPGYIGSVTTSIVVTAGATTTVNGLTLTRAGSSISGTVYKSGVAEANAWVWATNGSGGWVGAEADGNGNFTLEVTSGNWTIQAASEGYESVPVNVAAGTTGLSINLTNAISGYSPEAPTVAPIVPKTGGVIQGSDVKIEAPEGALDAQDTNTGRVSIEKTTSVPRSNDAQPLGNMAYEISVNNASGTPITVLNDSITISLSYSASDLSSAGITQTEALNMSLGYFDSTLNKWVTIPTNVATTSDGGVIFTGTTKHLSDFAPLKSSGAVPPSTPTGLTATAGDSQVTLTWNSVSGASYYAIYRKSGSVYPFYASTSNTSYTDTGLTNGTTYYYKISALNSDGDESAATEAVSATPTAPPSSGGSISVSNLGDTTPPSVSDIKVEPGTSTACLTWITNEPSISWVIYGTSTDYGSEIKTTDYLTSHSLTITGLCPETTYHYQIKSEDSSGNIGSYTDRTFTTLALGQQAQPAPTTTPPAEGPSVSPLAKPITEMTIDQLKAEIARISALIVQLQSQLLKLRSGVPQEIQGIPTDFSFQKNLFYGTTDQDVVYLKLVLENEGCLSGVKNTKWFGPKTKKAVQCFCQKYRDEISSFAGYPVRCSGLVGKGIRTKLNQLLGR